MAKKDDLKAEAADLGLEVTDEDTVASLEKKIADAKSGEKEGGEGSDKAPAAKEPSEGDQKAKSNEGVKLPKGGVFYHIKVRSYINDEERLEAGLYRFDKPCERLEKSPKHLVERYEGKVPQVSLHALAKSLRVSVTDKAGSFRSDADILADVVKEPAPMK